MVLVKEGDFSQMIESKNVTSQALSKSQAPSDVEKIPEDLSVEMRRIAHDLSNALEIIIQTSYLLSTTEMREPASDWLRMLDDGVQKAMNLNLALRTYIKEHTSRLDRNVAAGLKLCVSKRPSLFWPEALVFAADLLFEVVAFASGLLLCGFCRRFSGSGRLRVFCCRLVCGNSL